MRLVKRIPFIYHSTDVNSLEAFPNDWATQMIDVAESHAVAITLRPTHVTSRESPDIKAINTMVVGGLMVRDQLPWLYNAYRGVLRELGTQATGKQLHAAKDPRIGVVLNVMTPDTGRYEAHVDTNPVQGMLYAKTGSGGELVVAHNVSAVGIKEIDKDASIVVPDPGLMIYFDGRRPHYVTGVTEGYRVAAAMNFYTDGSPEARRPQDLTPYLSGE